MDKDTGEGSAEPPAAPLAVGEPGQPGALNAWLATNREELLRALRGLLKSPALVSLCQYRGQSVAQAADDLLSDTVLIALEREERFDPSRSSCAWLMRIAVNVLKRWRRESAIRHKRTDPMVFPEDVPGMTLADLSDAVVGALVTDHIMDMVNAKQREIIEMVVFHGWDHAEVADRLGINPGASRVRYHRALEALRDGLARRGIHSSADLEGSGDGISGPENEL